MTDTRDLVRPDGEDPRVADMETLDPYLDAERDAGLGAADPRHAGGAVRPTIRWFGVEGALWGVLVAAIVLLLALAALRALDRTAPPPALGAVPPFAFVDQNGETITRETVRGRPWLASFVFTRCIGVCPRMTERMRALADDLPPDGQVALLSFGVDPAHDTPEVLRDYAARHGADQGWLAEHWHFLYGPAAEMEKLSRDGFNLAVTRDPTLSPGDAIVHSSRFMLIDGGGQIRGYYDSFSDEALEQLTRDLRAVMRAEATGPIEPPPAGA
ncbi:MAG: SCO family protein [Acidobacteriota bacterium]